MVIVCSCEGPLAPPQGDVVRCMRCSLTYPTRDLEQILKMLRLAARETNHDGTPANEHVRNMALNKASKRIAALKLRVLEEMPQWRPAPPPPPPPPPVYAHPTVSGFTTTTFNTGGTGGFVDVIFNGMHIRMRFG